MKDDPAIQAVRDARHRISAAVGHDPRKLVEHYQRRQDLHQDRILTPPTQQTRREASASDVAN